MSDDQLNKHFEEVSEGKLQAACCTWFKNRYKRFNQRLYMITNDGPKSGLRAAQDLARGLTAGVSDLFLSIPVKIEGQYFAGFYMELKTGDGRLSKEQARFLDDSEELGYKVSVIRSVDQFKEEVIEYMKSIPESLLA